MLPCFSGLEQTVVSVVVLSFPILRLVVLCSQSWKPSVLWCSIGLVCSIRSPSRQTAAVQNALIVNLLQFYCDLPCN
jgi:hypothetical protein